MALRFPDFDPALFRVGPFHIAGHELGPFSVRWYALAYITGLVLGWRLVRRLVTWPPVVATTTQVDDFLTWATLGVVLGGRLGYVLFYQPLRFAAAPLEIFAVWDGGMSFHGGMLGVATAIVLFCRRERLSVLGFADRIAVAAPVGLFLGRIANFINGELWGRPAPDWLPWAMEFRAATLPDGQRVFDGVARHPSQLYQATLEGVVLFVVMLLLARRADVRARPGFLTGAFLAGYALARITGEFFREPDSFLHYFVGGSTMGQALSAPMLLAGLALMLRRRRRLALG